MRTLVRRPGRGRARRRGRSWRRCWRRCSQETTRSSPQWTSFFWGGVIAYCWRAYYCSRCFHRYPSLTHLKAPCGAGQCSAWRSGESPRWSGESRGKGPEKRKDLNPCNITFYMEGMWHCFTHIAFSSSAICRHFWRFRNNFQAKSCGLESMPKGCSVKFSCAKLIGWLLIFKPHPIGHTDKGNKALYVLPNLPCSVMWGVYVMIYPH